MTIRNQIWLLAAKIRQWIYTQIIEFRIWLLARRWRKLGEELRAMDPEDALWTITCMRWKLSEGPFQNNELMADAFNRTLGQLADEIRAKRDNSSNS